MIIPERLRPSLRWSWGSRTIALGLWNSEMKRSSTEASASPIGTDLRVNSSSKGHPTLKRIKRGLPEVGVPSGTRVRTKSKIYSLFP